MATLTWLHVSDFHYRQPGEATLDLDRLVDDVQGQLVRRGLRLDCVFFTGDLAFSGKPEEYVGVGKAFDRFLTKLKLKREQLFVVPGNHDVDRAISPTLPELKPAESNSAINKILLQKPRPKILDRQQAYQDFVTKFYDGTTADPELAPSGFWSVRQLQNFAHPVTVLCLNSAWLASGSTDRGNLALGEVQIKSALEGIHEGFCVALMHHPFAWLREHEETLVHRPLARACDFILCGHQHMPRFAQAPFGDKAMILSAGAAHERDQILSYNVVHLDLGSGFGDVYTRQWSITTPDFHDLDLSPERSIEGRLSLESLPGGWQPASTPRKPVVEKGPRRDAFRYQKLYTISSVKIPYIVLINSWKRGLTGYGSGEVETQVDPSGYILPELLRGKDDLDNRKFEQKCRFVRYETRITPGKSPNRLRFTFSEINYADYLRSGEKLDEPLPDDSNTTYRDVLAPKFTSWRDFSDLPLSNICGVGVFLITPDNYIIVSKHSPDVEVYHNVWSYSASGTMDWSDNPHPFHEIIRECKEEIGYEIREEELQLFALGIDAKKLYFQFSFFAHTTKSAEYIIDEAIHAPHYSAEMETLEAIPFELDTLVSVVLGRSWEPAAEAGLLTLCINRFGLEAVKKSIDPARFRQQWTSAMKHDWRLRAAREGELAVMSARYPTEQCEEESQRFVDAVLDFVGDDLWDLNVLEVGAGIGRLSEFLVDRVGHLTCIDLSEEMLARHKKRLGDRANRVTYHNVFAQDFSPGTRFDAVISSLVLIHNVQQDMFNKLVTQMRIWSNTLFLIEHVDSDDCKTSAITRLRNQDTLLKEFAGYSVEKSANYELFEDKLLFLKLKR